MYTCALTPITLVFIHQQYTTKLTVGRGKVSYWGWLGITTWEEDHPTWKEGLSLRFLLILVGWRFLIFFFLRAPSFSEDMTEKKRKKSIYVTTWSKIWKKSKNSSLGESIRCTGAIKPNIDKKNQVGRDIFKIYILMEYWAHSVAAFSHYQR